MSIKCEPSASNEGSFVISIPKIDSVGNIIADEYRNYPPDMGNNYEGKLIFNYLSEYHLPSSVIIVDFNMNWRDSRNLLATILASFFKTRIDVEPDLSPSSLQELRKQILMVLPQ